MSDHDESPAGLWRALLAARRASKGVGKSGRNQAQGWAFVTVEDVTREALRCLNEAGLVAVLCTKPSTTDRLTELDAWLHVVHAETGEAIRFPITWPIARLNDQGLRAAYSYARKQALVELLMIAEPDDPETTAGTGVAQRDDIPAPPARPTLSTRPAPKTITDAQLRKLHALFGDIDTAYGHHTDTDARRTVAATYAARDPDTLDTMRDLTVLEAGKVIDALEARLATIRTGEQTSIEET